MRAFDEIKPQQNCRVFVLHKGIPKKYFIPLKKEKMSKVVKNKDLNINTQSALKWVISYLEYRGIEDLSLHEIFRITDIVVEYQMYEKDQDFKNTLKLLDNWLNTRITNKQKINVE